MRAESQIRIVGGCALAIVLALGLSGRAADTTANAGCVDYSKDPAGCQPSTFDTPIGEMPTGRVN